MNYVNAKSSKVTAAVLSTAITVVVTASIVFGMAGLPTQDSVSRMAGNASPASAQVSIPARA